MIIVTQDGDSALTLAARHGLADGVVELVKAGANLDLQNCVSYMMWLRAIFRN